MKYSFRCLRSLSLTGFLVGSSLLAVAQTVNPNLYSGLVWRNVGPFRGGRVSAVSGAVGQPGVFYMGLPGGGLWKTTSAGTTWFPVMDGIKEASSVGAVAVAPSDPNVVYVGMGDMATGGAINEGNGIYKSMDAGKTWTHLGLDDSHQVPCIVVDPHDPNIVMVAAQGNAHAQSENRGIYRSTDGGKTWAKVLYLDETTGVEKIAYAWDHPETLLAVTDRHFSAGGRGGFGGGGGGRNNNGPSGTALFKSTDDGVTWKEVKGTGLPNLSGRMCVAIANGTNAQRMFIVGNSGLYRSDDGGGNWTRMDAEDRRVANGQGGYNCGVYVNPKDPDTVYVVNTCSYISRDGGKTFTGFKGAPGGDDPQQMWLDPTDGNRLFFGTDQGATISLDGGQNWSSWYNQPSAQVYHISVDNQFPYWIYATQQDSGSIGTASRGNLGEITPLDWLPHPGYEFGSIVADPLNPKVSYAGGPSGGIIKTTYPSGQWINVSPNMDSAAGLRKVGNQPLVWSEANPRELYAGFQYLMATTDGGMHWKKLSPDLGTVKGAEPAKPPTPGTAPKSGGNIEMDGIDDDEPGDDDEPVNQFGPGGSGQIESIGPSSVNGNVIWIGTSNGLVKVTKNHGATWDDVTIPNLPNANRADITAIDASHQDPGTAYLAIDYHNSADYKPFVYRTHDFGKTWTKIVNGLPEDQRSGSFARVIRADTVKSGLIFLGTESSVYVSFNDGDNWQPLTLNLPTTSYRDMVVKNNDLVVGTYGRGFWILDDMSPLRQIAATMQSETAHLFKPGDAIRVRRNVNGDTPFPPEIPHAVNPPVGAIIYYYLSVKPSSDIRLEIADSSGKVLRHMSSAAFQPLSEPPPPVPNFWVETPKPMPTEAGTNRISWNLRCDSPHSSFHSYEINANPGETPASPEGPLVPPGEYTVRLIVDGKTFTQTLAVKNDPRSPATTAELKAQTELQMKLYDAATEAWAEFQDVTAMRGLVAEVIKSQPADDLSKAAEDFDAKLALVGGSGGGGRRFGGGFGGGGGAAAPTFAGVEGSAVRFLGEMDSGDMTPSETMRKVCEKTCADLKTVVANWKALNAKDLVAFNAVLAKHSMKAIPSASSTVTIAGAAPGSHGGRK